MDSVFDFVSRYFLNPFSVFPIYFRLRVFLSVPILLGELVSKWNWNALEGCFLFIEPQISTTALETIWLIYTQARGAANLGLMGSVKPINFQKWVLEPINFKKTDPKPHHFSTIVGSQIEFFHQSRWFQTHHPKFIGVPLQA